MSDPVWPFPLPSNHFEAGSNISDGVKPLALVLNCLAKKSDQGGLGPTGPQGEKGDPGDRGSTGLTGPAGATGSQGIQGPTGLQGVAGQNGATGSAGVAGATGSVGAAGATGSTGPAGSPGVKGDTGAAGPTGATGPQGVQGVIGLLGPQGIQGPIGPTGSQGSAGVAGSQGIQGIQGATGANGLAGTIGPTGPTGLAGIAGAPGSIGTPGATGATGASGGAGPTGPQGVEGVQGARGDTGPTGSQGDTGPAGVNGVDGVDGAVGPTGADGAPAEPISFEQQLCALNERIAQLEAQIMGDVNLILRSGEVFQGDGGEAHGRSTKEGALVVSDVGARFGEGATRDRVFHVSTLAAGVAPGTVLSVIPPLAIYNPPGSNVILEMLSSTVGYVSGTLGAGCIVYAANSAAQPNDPATGAVLAIRSGKLGSGAQSTAKAFQGSTIAAVPNLLRAPYSLGAALATTASFPVVVKDMIDGEFVVDEGGLFIMQGITAGGALPLVILSASFRERQKT